MLTFATFGAGFLMGPLGAIFLGAYVERVDRRQGLIVTLALMALDWGICSGGAKCNFNSSRIP